MDTVTTAHARASQVSLVTTVVLVSALICATETVFVCKENATALLDTVEWHVRSKCALTTAATMDTATVLQRCVDVHRASQVLTAASTTTRECASTCVPTMGLVSMGCVHVMKDSGDHFALLPHGTARATAMATEHAKTEHACAVQDTQAKTAQC